jgi:hypothetical protein
MNSSQRQYLETFVRAEFARQGFRPEIKQAPQVDAAVILVDRAIKANVPFILIDELASKAVAHVRDTRLANVHPTQRTAAVCNCGKPKAPHSSSLHGTR